MITNLIDRNWLDYLCVNLDIYRIGSLNLPLIEKKNLDELIAEIIEVRACRVITMSGYTLKSTLNNLQLIEDSEDNGSLWVIENIAMLWQSSSLTDRQILEQTIIDLAIAIRDRRIAVIAIDYGVNQLPYQLKPLIPHHILPLPTPAAIKSILAEFRLTSNRLTTICAGLGCEEIRVGLRIALKTTHAIAIDADQIEQSLLKYKIAKLKEVGLEFLGAPDVSEFGGLDRIAAGTIEVIKDFSPQAQKVGIARPKGWLFVGPPGTGKTHTAKCIATQLRWPLVSVGIDAIKEGGADLLKSLLVRIEATAPCVVYFDELDKFFSSTTDAQILGVILTWLQEKTSETFVIATLNRLEKLPPELTRAGRFDRQFYIGFPNELERYQIIRLYAGRYDPVYQSSVYGGLDRQQWLNLLNETEKFTGAELKQIVDRAAKLDFYQHNSTLINYQNLMSARKDTVSLYERNPEGILAIENQAKRFSEPASSKNNTEESLFKVESINLFGS